MQFHLLSPKCIAPYRLPPPRDAIPNPAPPLLAKNSFLLLAVATLRSDSRSGAGEGTAPLQTRVSQPKPFHVCVTAIVARSRRGI